MSIFKRKVFIYMFFWTILPIFSTLYANIGFSDTNLKSRNVTAKRDPFVTLQTEKRAPVRISGLHGVMNAGDIEIQGLVHDEVMGSYVIANGVVLMEGEQEAEVTVLEITDEGVRFLIDGQVQYKYYNKNSESGG